MFEEQTNQDASTDNEQPGSGQSEVSNEAPQDDESLLDSDSGIEPEQPEEENDEIEVDGKKFALPKSAAEKLKAERMMHADYTRKTQEAAEQRRALEAEVTNFQKQRQEHQQYLTELADVVSIDRQLEAYAKLDWQALIDQDQALAMKYQQQVRELERQKAEKVGVLQQKQEQIALTEQQSLAKRVQDADAYFAREIAGWSPARSDQLLKYGVAEGTDAKALAHAVISMPQIAKWMHKAELYDQIAKKQKPPAAAPAAAPAKPAAKVGQNANVKKDPTKMSDAEYAAYRRRVQSSRK